MELQADPNASFVGGIGMQEYIVDFADIPGPDLSASLTSFNPPLTSSRLDGGVADGSGNSGKCLKSHFKLS